MVGPRIKPGMQGPLDQLMVMPPWVRIAAGAGMLAMGSAGIVMVQGFAGLVLLGTTAAVGLPLLLSGLADRRTQAHEREERARAEVDLPYLKDAVGAAVQQKQDVARLLRKRGYTSDKVRRWIALECGVVLRSTPGDREDDTS